MGDILSLQEIVQIFLDIAYICLTDYFLSHKYSVKGFFKEFTLLGISVAILLIKEVVGTSILIVRLPPASKIFDLDCRSCLRELFDSD